MSESHNELSLLLEQSTLVPSRKRLLIAFICSVLIHSVGYVLYRYTPAVQMAYGLREITFVDEDYNAAILLSLAKPMKYPGNYPGFTDATKVLDLAAVKAAALREEQKRAAAKKRAELAARKQKAKAAEQTTANNDSAASQTAAKQDQPAAAATPKPPPSGFQPINTRPIRDQIQRLYDLYQEGKLAVNSQKLRVGVMGEIKPDGSIINYRVFIKSGDTNIDQAALAIIAAVSESKALGPLSQLTSLSMILTVDEQQAQLVTVGFAPDAKTASDLQNLAQLGVTLGKKLKAGDPASLIFLNNLKLSQSGNRIQATIAVPRQTASDTLAKTMLKKSTTGQ